MSAIAAQQPAYGGANSGKGVYNMKWKPPQTQVCRKDGGSVNKTTECAHSHHKDDSLNRSLNRKHHSPHLIDDCDSCKGDSGVSAGESHEGCEGVGSISVSEGHQSRNGKAAVAATAAVASATPAARFAEGGAAGGLRRGAPPPGPLTQIHF